MLVERFSSVGRCSNRFFRGMLGYGKSPCFSGCGLSASVDVDRGGHCLTRLNMEVSSD